MSLLLAKLTCCLSAQALLLITSLWNPHSQFTDQAPSSPNGSGTGLCFDAALIRFKRAFEVVMQRTP